MVEERFLRRAEKKSDNFHGQKRAIDLTFGAGIDVKKRDGLYKQDLIFII